MKSEYNIYVLTTIMILVSISWGVSYFQDKSQILHTHIDITSTNLITDFDDLSVKQIYDLIGPSLYSGNIALMAKTLAQFQSLQAHSLLEYVITQKEQVLSDQELVILVCAVAKRYESKKDRDLLFNLFLQHKTLFTEIPLLYTIATSNYKSLIPDVSFWIQEHPEIRSYFYNADLYALMQNNIEAFQTLLVQSNMITKEEANQLLLKAIKHEVDAQFIHLLVQELGADVNYSSDGKKTVLIEAVIRNNPSLVSALLKEGADKDLLLDPVVGTALQIAIVQETTEAELVLREFGARE